MTYEKPRAARRCVDFRIAEGRGPVLPAGHGRTRNCSGMDLERDEPNCGCLGSREHGGGDLGPVWDILLSFKNEGSAHVFPVLCCAKSLQLCPTLCDPMDCSPPGSSVHGIL